MVQQEEKIIELIQKCINKQSTDSEIRSLVNWLKMTDNHNSFSNSSQKTWQMIDAEKNILLTEEERFRLQSESIDLLRNSKTNNITTHRIKNNHAIFFRFVAILAIIFSATFAIYMSNSKAPQRILYTQQETKNGECKKIVLKDGTQVILNATSKIIIPTNFNEDSRLITLEGEAFFDVAHNAEKPFIIQSGDAKIKVLGTSFNVKSHQSDDLMAITVSTGKVNVGLANEELQLNLTANQHLTINKVTGDFEKKKISGNNYIKWQSGALYFEKEPIQEVLKELNRKYNRKVILQNNIGNYKISGIHDNKSLEAVVESICYTTGLNFKTVGENILIYKTNQKTPNTHCQ